MTFADTTQRTKSGTLQGTRSRHTKANLAKSLPCANAQAHPPPSGRTSHELQFKLEQDNHHQQPNEAISNIFAKDFGIQKKTIKFDKIVKNKFSK